MTVVGRASISRWVVDEILERFFHPCLDPGLSAHLKAIEQNIRRNHHDPTSIEEDDALSSKVCNWRLTTLDALQHDLKSTLATEYRARLTQHLVEKLVASLQMHLREPAPTFLLSGVSMIVDIAIGLASHLPLESRDVRVWYPVPGVPFDHKFMKAEGQLPPLLQPIAGPPPPPTGGAGQGDNASGEDKSVMDLDPQAGNADDQNGNKPDIKNTLSVNGPGGGAQSPSTPQPGGPQGASNPGKSGDQPPRNKFGKLRQRIQETATGSRKEGHGAAPAGTPAPAPPGKQGGVAVTGETVQTPAAPQGPGGPGGAAGGPVGGPAGTGGQKDEHRTVRIAGFMAVEVRGRSILVKAPVWC